MARTFEMKWGDAVRSDSIGSDSLWNTLHFLPSQHWSESWKLSNFLRSLCFSACPSPTLWEDKPAQWWMLAELHKALYCIPSHPTPSSRVLPSKEDAVGVPCPRGDTRKSQQCRARKVPGCPCTLWLLFASSGLNSCWDLGGPGYKIMDPMPFRLHRAGGKAATWSECCWLWICPAFGLFSVGLKVMLFCYH